MFYFKLFFKRYMIWGVKEMTGSKQVSIMFPPKIAAALAERLSVSEQRAFIREAVAEKMNREFNLNFSENDYATKRGKRTDVEMNAAEVLPVLQARAKKARATRAAGREAGLRYTMKDIRAAIEELDKNPESKKISEELKNAVAEWRKICAAISENSIVELQWQAEKLNAVMKQVHASLKPTYDAVAQFSKTWKMTTQKFLNAESELFKNLPDKIKFGEEFQKFFNKEKNGFSNIGLDISSFRASAAKFLSEKQNEALKKIECSIHLPISEGISAIQEAVEVFRKGKSE